MRWVGGGLHRGLREVMGGGGGPVAGDGWATVRGGGEGGL